MFCVPVMDPREAAWDAVHEALPARWRIGPPGYDPGTHRWLVSAVGPHPGRGKLRQSVTGSGEDEAAALRRFRQAPASARRATPPPSHGRSVARS